MDHTWLVVDDRRHDMLSVTEVHNANSLLYPEKKSNMTHNNGIKSVIITIYFIYCLSISVSVENGLLFHRDIHSPGNCQVIAIHCQNRDSLLQLIAIAGTLNTGTLNTFKEQHFVNMNLINMNEAEWIRDETSRVEPSRAEPSRAERNRTELK